MLKIATFSQRMNPGSSSQENAKSLDERVNTFLTREKVSFSDIKRFDITTLQENGNISTGGQSSSHYTYSGDVFLVYTLMIEKSDTESGNL